MRRLTMIILAALTFICETNSFAQTMQKRQWPSYRGYMLSGVLDNANLPDTFNINSNLNILWNVDIPGLGISSPVIWGNNLFITTAISKSEKAGFKPGIYGDVRSVNDASVHEWRVMCFDKNTGNLKWDKVAYKGVPAMKRHPKSTHANCSVATDGEYVVAFFGSEGLYCYNMKGDLMWKKDFGILKSVFFMMPDAQWEFASSPVIYNEVLVIQCDVLENSFLAAYDVATGKELWKTDRNDYPGWCTPNIYMNGNKTCIAVNGFKHIGGYDFNTGKELWRMSGGGDIPIPSPVIGKQMIYFNSAHGKFSPVFAVSTEATGDITLPDDSTSNKFVKWSLKRGGSYLQTMLLYHDRLYNLTWNGLMNCLDPFTGKTVYNTKIGKSKSFVASPVASDGKIYIVDEEGTVYIISDGDTFKQISEIPLNDICMTAPSITDGRIYFRTQKSLIAVGKR